MTNKEILTALSESKGDDFITDYLRGDWVAIEALAGAQDKIVINKALRLAFALGRRSAHVQAEKSRRSCQRAIDEIVNCEVAQ